MNTLLKILFSPKDAFALIKDEGGMALPIVVVLVCMGFTLGLGISELEDAPKFLFFLGFNEQQIAETPQPIVLMIVVGVFVLMNWIVYLIILLIHAWYLKAVSRISKDGISFADWMSFVSWGRVPYVIGFIVTIIAFLVGDETHGNWLSISYYVPPPSSMWGSLLASSLDLPLIWALAVMTVGYRVWTEKSMVESASIVCGPFVVLYALVWLLG